MNVPRTRRGKERRSNAADLKGETSSGVFTGLRQLTELEGLALGTDEVRVRILEAVATSFAPDNCSLMFLDEKKRELELSAAFCPIDGAGRSYGAGEWKGKRFALGEGIVGKAAGSRQTVIVEDVAREVDFVVQEGSPVSLRSLVCIPLAHRGEMLGALNMSHGEPGWFAGLSAEVLALTGDLAAHVLASRAFDSELQEVRERLCSVEATARALLDAPTDGMLLMDRHGVVLAVNESAAQKLGRKAEEFVGKDVFGYLPPDVAARRRELLEQVLGSGKPHQFQETSKGATIDHRVFPIFDAHGEITRVAVFARDVTEQKRAEQRIAMLHNCFLRFGAEPERNINALVGLCGELLGASCALYNRLEGDLLRAVGRWHAPQDFEPVDKAEGHICYDVIREGREDLFLIRNLAETRYAQSDPSVLRYGLQTYLGMAVRLGAQPIGSFCLLYDKDIVPTDTDRWIMEIAAGTIGVEELRAQAEEARQHRVRIEHLVTDISTHFINLATDEIDAAILDALKALGEFAGFDRGYVFQFADERLRVFRTYEWCAEGIQPVAYRAEGWSLDEAAFWATGLLRKHEVFAVSNAAELPAEAGPEKRYMEGLGVQSLVVVPMVYDKQLVGLLGFEAVRASKSWSAEDLGLLRMAAQVLVNALQRKHTDQIIAEQRAKMAAASKMSSLGEMASGVAHEINNPLAVISGAAEQLIEAVTADQVNRDSVARLSARISRNTTRIGRIVRSLRIFSRDDDRDPRIEVSLLDIVAETLELCRARFRAHRIALEVGPIPADLRIECRPTQIAQVLLNLLNNAHDAIENLDEKWVRLDVEDRGGYVELSVTDSGKGLPEAIKDKVLQPFFTTKEVGKGIGLGLSISKGFVEGHGGELRLDPNSPNTRFVVRLPRKASTPIEGAR